MPPRLPVPSDLPSLSFSTVPNPEAPTPPTNILVLLHGLGDSEKPFQQLGSQLKLPSTCVVAVRAPQPLPFDLGGFHWGDDIKMNDGPGAAFPPLEPDAGFRSSSRALFEQLVIGVLIVKCHFSARNILLWGFGQGGMLALKVGAELDQRGRAGDESINGGSDVTISGQKELAGIISVGGPLPEEVSYRTGKGEVKVRTPVLVLGGASATAITDEQVDRIKRVYEFVERTKWRRSGDGMPRDRGEMMPIMQFLARRLQASTPEGMVEIA